MSDQPTQHVCAKPFATPHRRFAAGTAITEADITGDLSFADWKDKGFIAEAAAAPAAGEGEAEA